MARNHVMRICLLSIVYVLFGNISFASGETIYCVTPIIPQYSSTSNGEQVKIGMYISSGSMAEIEGRKADNGAFKENGTMEMWDGKEKDGGKRLNSRSYQAGQMVVYGRIDLKYINPPGIHYLYGKFISASGGVYWTDKIIASIVEQVNADFSGSPLSGTAPLKVSFQNLSTGSVQSSKWTVGSYTSTSPNPQFTLETPGSYDVCLEVFGPNGCGYDYLTREDYILVAGAPEEKWMDVDFSAAPREGYEPLSVQFTSTVTGTARATYYTWNFGDGKISVEQNPLHTYEKAAVYTVTLDVSGEGVSAREVKPEYITVKSVKSLTADFYGSPRQGKAPLTVKFTSAVSGNVTVDSYSWNFGDSSTSTVAYPEHTYLTAGNYTVKLTVNGQGLSDSEEKQGYIIVEKQEIPPPCAYFTGEPRKGERPLKVYFKSTCDAASITSYLWMFGDGETATTREVNHTFKNAGKYTVSLRVSGPSGEGFLEQKDYVEVIDPDFALHFPLSMKTPWTATINSVFDHSMEKTYTADYSVVAFTGEEGFLEAHEDPETSKNAHFVTTINGNDLYGFKNANGSRFRINGYYSGGTYLYYDGHAGFDYKTVDQHPQGKASIYAAYAGRAILQDGGGTHGVIKIDHGNGYVTTYMHCSAFFISDGQWVETGQLIATAGDKGAEGKPHLHFEVRYNGIPVDPYGWEGKNDDPYTLAFNRLLWYTVGGGSLPPEDVDEIKLRILDEGVEFIWSYASEPSNLAGFFLYMSQEDEWGYLETLGPEKRSTTVSGLIPDHQYFFRLTAFNEVNEESAGKVIAFTAEDITDGSESDDDGGDISPYTPEQNTDEGDEDGMSDDDVRDVDVACGENGKVDICGVVPGRKRTVPLLFIAPFVILLMRMKRAMA